MMENPAVLTATIAFLGVITSVSASLAITFLSTRSEMRKLKTSLKNQYASAILEKRMNVYGECYYILSNFVKRAHGFINTQTPITYSDLDSFNLTLSEWDSKNALLLRPGSVALMLSLRINLRDILKEVPVCRDAIYQNGSDIDKLVTAAKTLEMALRNDIAIYEVEMHEERSFFMSNREFVKNTSPELLPSSELFR
jgi:hypothetical protein